MAKEKDIDNNAPKVDGTPIFQEGEGYVKKEKTTGRDVPERIEVPVVDGENKSLVTGPTYEEHPTIEVRPVRREDYPEMVTPSGKKKDLKKKYDTKPVFDTNKMDKLQVHKVSDEEIDRRNRGIEERLVEQGKLDPNLAKLSDEEYMKKYGTSTWDQLEYDVSAQDRINKSAGDVLSKEYGDNPNVFLTDGGVWMIKEGETYHRLTNPDGSYNLKNGDILGVDGKRYTEDEYYANKYDTSTRDGRRKKGADKVQQAYNDLRDALGREPSYKELELQLRGLGINRFNAANGVKSGMFISNGTIEKLSSNYNRYNKAGDNQILNDAMLRSRDKYGQMRKDREVAIINGQTLTQANADALANEIKGFVHDNPEGVLSEEQTTILNNVLSKYGINIPKDTTGTTSGILAKLMNEDEAIGDLLDSAGINVDSDTVTFDEKDVDLNSLFNDYREKRKLDKTHELDEKEAERKRLMANISTMFSGVGDTIRAAYGAKVFQNDGGKSLYDQINNDVKQKAQIYEAKMQALKDKALEEKRRQEAIALEKAKIEDQQRHDENMAMFNRETQYGVTDRENNYKREKDADDARRESEKNSVKYSVPLSGKTIVLPDKNKDIKASASGLLSNFKKEFIDTIIKTGYDIKNDPVNALFFALQSTKDKPTDRLSDESKAKYWKKYINSAEGRANGLDETDTMDGAKDYELEGFYKYTLNSIEEDLLKAAERVGGKVIDNNENEEQTDEGSIWDELE